MRQSRSARPLKSLNPVLARALQRNDSILRVVPAAWDRLQPELNPFTAHAYLAALEASGSASAVCGWQRLHGILGDPTHPEAAVPLSAKSHSWGDYGFDRQWARAHERAVGPYFPKRQVAVPWTAVAGPRLLASDAATRRKLIPALEDLPASVAVSLAHVTFCAWQEVEWFQTHGWLIRQASNFIATTGGTAALRTFSRRSRAAAARPLAANDGRWQLWGSGSAPCLQTSSPPRSLKPSIPSIKQRSTGMRVKPISAATFFADSAPSYGIGGADRRLARGPLGCRWAESARRRPALRPLLGSTRGVTLFAF